MPKDLLRSQEELIPPAGMIYTGRGDFKKAGKYWLQNFIKYAGLKPENSFLDIGSGIGRIAAGLTPYLNGRYEGFDAVKQGVDWCTEHISTRFPNFQFTFVDLYNDLYTANGIQASTYTFPFEEAQFNVACAISVFTHMLPEEVERYLEESCRVATKDGVLVATFFVLNDISREKMKTSRFKFPFEFQHYALMDKNVKSANVAYDQSYLWEMAGKAGWIISDFLPGYWSGIDQTEGHDFQDILILKKK